MFDLNADELYIGELEQKLSKLLRHSAQSGVLNQRRAHMVLHFLHILRVAYAAHIRVEQDQILERQILRILPVDRAEVRHASHQRLEYFVKRLMLNLANFDDLIVDAHDRVAWTLRSALLPHQIKQQNVDPRVFQELDLIVYFDVFEIKRLTRPVDHQKAPFLQQAANDLAHVARAQIDLNRAYRLNYAALGAFVHQIARHQALQSVRYRRRIEAIVDSFQIVSRARVLIHQIQIVHVGQRGRGRDGRRRGRRRGRAGRRAQRRQLDRIAIVAVAILVSAGFGVPIAVNDTLQ